VDNFSPDTSQQQKIDTLNSLCAELMLDKALRDFQIEQIYKEIDRSLQCKNEEEFLRLTEELKVIHRA
jgi:uncharacterized protein YpiB (UPF0302 family)